MVWEGERARFAPRNIPDAESEEKPLNGEGRAPGDPASRKGLPFGKSTG